jgi:hypothetical protein
VDAGDGHGWVVKHELGFEALDTVAEPDEGAVAAGVGPEAAEVRPAVDFDDQAGGGSEEVGDVATGNRDLAPQAKPTSCELPLASIPKPPARPCGSYSVLSSPCTDHVVTTWPMRCRWTIVTH